MKRRDFLLAAGAGVVAATGAGLPAARATQRRQARRLLIVFANGGWDTSYALDPKEPTHVDIPAGRPATFEQLDVFVDDSRPAITQFFEQHAPNTAIVRGIAIDAINHNESQRRIATGTREETNPDFGAIVAHDAGNDLPMPYLVLGNLAWTGPYAVSAARLGANNQILDLIDEPQPRVGFPFDDRNDRLLRAYALASSERARATRGALGYNRRRVDDFVQALARGDQLRAMRGKLGQRGEALSYSGQIELALDALERSLSQAVMVGPRLDFDTHTDNRFQGRMQDTVFGGLVRIVGELKRRPGRAAGTRMIDDTVVVVISEFSRTQRLTSAAPEAGKDHWPVACSLVIGAGVRGGRVFGATDADQVALPIDLATGLPAAEGTRPLYAHFVAGVLALCGVDPDLHLPDYPVFDAFIA